MDNGNPSRVLRVVRISEPCDPAIDLDHVPPPAPPGAPRPAGIGELLSRYERSRSDADRDALPLRPGCRPYVFELRPLGRRQAAVIADLSGEHLRAEMAVQLTCHAYTTPSGERRTATLTTIHGVQGADESWLDELHELPVVGGLSLFRELAAIATRRAEVGAAALDPFGLPRGARLPR